MSPSVVEPDARVSQPEASSGNIVPFRRKSPDEESSAPSSVDLVSTHESEVQGVAQAQESVAALEAPSPERGLAQSQAVNGHAKPSRDDASGRAAPLNGHHVTTPARSDESSSAREASVDGTDWATARRSWRRVVDHLRPNANIVAAWLVQARLKRLEPGIIELDFEPEMSTFTDGERHQSIVAEAAHEALAELWDGSWSVHFNVMEISTPETAHNKSLASEDADVIAARKDRARELIAAHDLVTQAQAIFNPDKMQIILDDDEFYSRDLFH